MSKFTKILLMIGLVAYAGYHIYKMPKFDDGERVPGFEAILENGRAFSLDDLQGSYVLLDFWGSWCGPCRVESPSLVGLNSTYKEATFTDAKGFEIVSVAIETNKERWLRAIAVDGLDWDYHIAEFERFESPIATQYGVKEIPTKYMLDTKGKVIMVNPSFQEIATFLNSKIK